MKDISLFLYFKKRFQFKLVSVLDLMDFKEGTLLRRDNNFLLRIKINIDVLASEYKIIPNKILSYYGE